MLTAAQERMLAVSLRNVETELAWIETMLGWTYRGVTVAFDDDLREPALAALRSGIEEAREQIRAWTRLVRLETEVIPKSRWIAARLIQLWVVAEESRTPHLRGYGRITPEMVERVDPAARRLSELLLAMERVAHAETPDAAATSFRNVLR